MGGHKEMKKGKNYGQNFIFIEFQYIKRTLHLFIEA